VAAFTAVTSLSPPQPFRALATGLGCLNDFLRIDTSCFRVDNLADFTSFGF
jgi:hypothetical protein